MHAHGVQSFLRLGLSCQLSWHGVKRTTYSVQPTPMHKMCHHSPSLAMADIIPSRMSQLENVDLNDNRI